MGVKKVFKRIIKIVLAVVLTIILLAGGYVGYVLLSYSRVGDEALAVTEGTEKIGVFLGNEYKVLSYNVGFGAYSQDYTFFLDEGYDDYGNKTCGKRSRAKSKAEVLFNVGGAIAAAFDQNADFLLFQEVDTSSTRSYKVDQDEMIRNKFPSYYHTHALNFHTAFLPYPVYEMHGKVRSGLTTLSKYKINSAYRYEYTVSTSFSKYFDLDRCFSSHEIDISGSDKKLYLVNSHMSAYDESGEVRKKQIRELKSFMDEKSAAGHYVVVGGDWNHDLLTFNPDFSYTDTSRPYAMTKRPPDWLAFMFDDKGNPMIDGYQVVASDNYPSCRNNDIEYDPPHTFVCTVDGFLVSENVQVVSHETVLTKNGDKGLDGFAFSDHEPTVMTFRLG